MIYDIVSTTYLNLFNDSNDYFIDLNKENYPKYIIIDFGEQYYNEPKPFSYLFKFQSIFISNFPVTWNICGSNAINNDTNNPIFLYYGEEEDIYLHWIKLSENIFSSNTTYNLFNQIGTDISSPEQTTESSSQIVQFFFTEPFNVTDVTPEPSMILPNYSPLINNANTYGAPDDYILKNIIPTKDPNKIFESNNLNLSNDLS
jgi:hypothetical protein